MDALLGFLGLLVIGYVGIVLLFQGFKVWLVVFEFLFGWMLNPPVKRDKSPSPSPKPMILDSQNNVAARAERRFLQECKERGKEKV